MEARIKELEAKLEELTRIVELLYQTSPIGFRTCSPIIGKRIAQ